jgi:hypothetical protein
VKHLAVDQCSFGNDQNGHCQNLLQRAFNKLPYQRLFFVRSARLSISMVYLLGHSGDVHQFLISPLTQLASTQKARKWSRVQPVRADKEELVRRHDAVGLEVPVPGHLQRRRLADLRDHDEVGLEVGRLGELFAIATTRPAGKSDQLIVLSPSVPAKGPR